ncbi:MAG: hypothetical protein K0Q65_1835 [Clostridia bacterium]|jgi:hypothetical protein|nr:hypothetical protein [Clostridia bacterium]
MRKSLICLGLLIITFTVFATGCRSGDTEQQLKEQLAENALLKQENAELNMFKDRFSFSLSKIENTLFNLRNEGYLPFAGSQVNAPEMIAALPEIRNIIVETENDELILSMMPQEWSEDFNTILIVYDVYKPVLNMSADDAGKVSRMAGIFKRADGKWELLKFTREFKGDESFTIKNI